MIIDCHAHLVPPSLLDAIRAQASAFPSIRLIEDGGSLGFSFAGGKPTRPVSKPLSDLPARLKWMDEQNIERQVVGGWLDMFGYEVPAEEGAAWSRLINTHLAQTAMREPRFVPLATVPLQDGTRAAEVLREAHAAGFKGAMIGTQPKGKGGVLDDPLLQPFWEAANELGSVVFIHPVFESGDDRVHDYGMANAVGRITDTLIAMSRLIYAGHVTRYANAKIVAGIGGAALPYVVGRLRRNYSLDKEKLGDPDAALAGMYYDTIVQDPRTLRYLADIVGAERVMMGSDMPFPIGDLAPTKIVAETKLSDSERAASKGGRGSFMNRFLAGLACIGTLLSSGAARAQAPEPLSIVVFGPPSLGAFLPPVIKAQKLDEQNGLAIKFEERTPDAYTAQFNSGEFQLGGSASLLTVGLADTRGVKVTYLFNLFDYWGAVVTSRPDVKTLRDLEGKDVAAAKGTTNWVMFDWFARQLGADTAKFSVINTATPGLIGYALADRAAAVQLWEPAYTTLLSKKAEMRTIDLAIADSWKKFTGSRNIPYLGVAAHIDWVEKNPTLVPKLYATYREAADWVTAHPDDASKLIAPKGTPDDQKAIADLIRANDRLGMNVQWAADVAKEIKSVYAAGRSIAFLPSEPSAATIYQAPGK